MGVLQAALPAVSGRDQTSTLDVDLAQSHGQLLSGTDDDRDTFRTLCYVEGANGQFELISYKTATLVSGNRYRLTDLRRGVYGTPVLAHASGMRFLRIDDAVTRLTFSATDVGKTAYFKFTSFNLVGLAEEDIAAVTAYSYLVQGLYNNFGHIVSNDAVVESALEPGNATAVVRAHRSGGAITDAITTWKSDGTTRTVSAVSYPGKSLTTWYWVMYNPDSDTCYLATSVAQRDQAAGWGHICLGSTQTPAADGSGGYTGGGGGIAGGSGGGGSYCPSVEMLVDGTMRAAEVVEGTPLDCIEPLDGTRYQHPVNRATIVPSVPCVCLVAENGAEKEVSTTTPFTLPTGENCYAVDMLGKLVWTDEGRGTPAKLSPIVRVIDIGLRDVVAIDLGGRTFAAGKSATLRMYSHNSAKASLPNTN